MYSQKTKTKTDSSRTVRRHPFCPGGNKKDAKNACLLAEGIFFCRASDSLINNSDGESGPIGAYLKVNSICGKLLKPVNHIEVAL